VQRALKRQRKYTQISYEMDILQNNA